MMNNSHNHTMCYNGQKHIGVHITEKDVQSHFSSRDSSTPLMSRVKKKFNNLYGVSRTDHETIKPSFRIWMNAILVRISPAYGFAQNYTTEIFLHDLAAGLSVGLASIPMGMSYALLAGFAPVYGLYTDFIYPLIYMLFGGQPQICVGTSAIEAIMTGEAIDKLLPVDATLQERASMGTRLALLVGIILLIMRVFGLGLIAHFLAYPVLSGFSTGSAIVIATAQLKSITGIRVPPHIRSALETWVYVVTHYKNVQWVAVATTFFGILVIIVIQRINASWFQKYPIPSALFLMGLHVPLGFFLSSKSHWNQDLVGSIAQGFPGFLPVEWDFINFYPLLKQALAYSIFYFIIHITIAKTVAQQESVTLDSHREMLACGLCSFIGSFFQCYPIATSLSRTSIATASGAMTPFYNIMYALSLALEDAKHLFHRRSSAVVGLALSSATHVLSYLPKASLSAVVLTGVYRMIFIHDAVNFFFISPADFFLWVICCSVVVWRGALEGVTVAVVASLIWLLKKEAFPAVVELGRLPNTKIYRDIRRFPMALVLPHCRILRFDASLHFANTDCLEHSIYHISGSRQSSLDKYAGSLNAAQKSLATHTIIIDASSINDMDITAVRMLKTAATELAKNNISLLFANWKGPMRDFLERSGFYGSVKPDHCFLSLHDAVVWSQTMQSASFNKPHSPALVHDPDNLPHQPKFPDPFLVSPETIPQTMSYTSHKDLLGNASLKTTTPYNTTVQFVTESTGSVVRNWPIVIQRNLDGTPFSE